jgi:two-component sensor histidine kinase
LPGDLLAGGLGSSDLGDLRHVLEELGVRVEMAVQRHRLLTAPPSDAMVELGAYLQDFSGAIVAASAASGDTDLRFDCEGGCHLSATRALAIVLVVIELVTNAVRHAHPSGVDGAIRIGCRRAPDGRIHIAVDDDGVGLPDRFDPTKDGRVGLRLVRMLSGQLGGQLDFVSSPLGLSVSVHVPAEEAA